MADKGWVPTRLCLCCGRFIVLLKRVNYDGGAEPRKWISCYFKGWDGNPWYVLGKRVIGIGGPRGNAVPHPRKRFAQRMARTGFPMRNRKPKEALDPFFSLETSNTP